MIVGESIVGKGLEVIGRVFSAWESPGLQPVINRNVALATSGI